MKRLVRYEWKKIWGSRLNQLTVLGCCLFLLFCVYSVIVQTYAVDEKGNSVSGMEAVKTMKELPTVQVTQENVEQFMQKYLDCTEDPQTPPPQPHHPPKGVGAAYMVAGRGLAPARQHGRSDAGTGISTRHPSTTPVGLALGPDSPRAD